MIFINENDAIGSKAFAINVFEAIKPTLQQRVSSMAFKDFENDIEFFKEIDFTELSGDTFAAVVTAIEKADIQGIDSDMQTALVKLMQADPRFKESIPA
ncbi:MAG: hypothetical protein Q4P13_09170 [Psychrobacter sp.]|nr:hypothetical protein [Psychrobacter sp.]